MDKRDVQDINQQLELARSKPERAMGIVIDMLWRIVLELQNQAEEKMGVNASIKQIDRHINGWIDNDGKRHSGISEISEQVLENQKEQKRLSEANGKRTRNIGIAVAVGITLEAIKLWLAAHVKL